MDKREIIEKLKVFIEGEASIVIQDEKQKLDIDSFTMMMVITFVKMELKTELDVDKMDFDNFTSLDLLADLVLMTQTGKV